MVPRPQRSLSVLLVVAAFACATDVPVGPGRIVSLAVLPGTGEVLLDDSLQLVAVGVNEEGVSFVGVPTTWSSSDAGAAPVDSRGLVRGTALGTATITAASHGLTATASVTVQPPPVIALSASTVAFNAVAGGPNPAAAAVQVTNTGGATLGDLTVDPVVYVSGTSGWLSATLSGPAAPAALSFTPAIGALPVGTYQATVSVLSARASNSPQVVTVTLSLTAGAPTQVAGSAGDGQSAPVNTSVTTPPAVVVRDQFDNPVPGVEVVFAVGSGGGAVTGATATTNASGVAAVGSWRLGTAAGANTLTATATALPGSPVTFTATAVAGPPAQLAIEAGDGQTTQVGTAVPVPPSARVSDQFGNVAAGATVVFAPTTGGGIVTGGTATSDVGGIAAVGSWTLGPAAGDNTLTATLQGAGVTTTFTATGTPGPATQITAQVGDAQTATVGGAVATPPAVRVSDQFGNAVAGFGVTFVVASGGGSLTGGNQTTDGSGVATVGSWTLGTTAGPNAMTATAPGLGGSPVTFTATATAGVPTQVAVVTGNGQTATVVTTVAAAPAVIVRDQFNNPVQGIGVQFIVTAGGGSTIPPSGTTVGTGASGVAALTSWTLGSAAGENTVTATVAATGVAGSPVTFTATGSAGAATQITVNAGNNQAATVNTAVATAPSVIVRDQFDNPVQGVPVAFAVTGGGGSVAGGGATTNPSGIAAPTSWTLGQTAGTNTVAATSTGLAGSTVTFTATGTAGAATQIASNGGDGQSATVNTTVATAPSVIVRDQFGNPVAGVPVTFSVTGGGGTISPASPATMQTNASGIASVTSWTLGITAGTSNNTLLATAGGLVGSPVTFTASAATGPAAQITISAGNNQSATINSAVPTPPAVLVGDQFNNPVAGVAVTFTIAGGGGTISPASPATVLSGATGIAQLTSWTLGSTVGANTLSAAAPGLSGSPLTFTATAIAGAATQMALFGGNAQTGTVGTALPTAYAVRVLDAASNPVPGVTVAWTVTGGGGSITPSSQTDANGVATATRTLGTTAGTQTARGEVGGLAGSPVNFTATATAGPATQIALNAGNNQSATVNTAVATAPSVLVRDQFNNPVQGRSVTFTVTGGGGTIVPASPATVQTNASGIAQVTSWTLGTVAGTNTLQAAASGLAGSPVTFTATGTAGAATQIAPNAGNGQSATVNTAVATPPSVLVRDQFNNPVQGHSVAFTVTGGGGTIVPASPATVQTNASGIAQVASWTMGTSPGTNTLQAAATGLAGSPVTFTATATAGGATQIAPNAGNNQTAVVNTTLTTAPSVIVRDQFNNPVAGVSVTFTVTGGSGTIVPASPATAQTNASGIAQVTSWTLGTVAGTNTLQATASGLAGSPVTFTATGTAGAATQIALNAGNGQSATVNTAVATPPSVVVRDQFNNPVQGHSVTFTVAGGGGNIVPASPATVQTNVSGIAQVTSWTLGTTAGTNTLQASATGLTGSPVIFTATGTAGAPSGTASTIATTSPITACSVSCTTGGGTQSIITITVRDAFNNAVNGASVTWAASGTGNAATNTTGTTNASGVFNAGRLSSTVAQTKTVSATINGSVAITPTGSVVVNPDPVSLSNSIVTATSPITASSGSSVSTVTVTVRDQFGNGISGRTVTIAVSPPAGNTVTQPASTTNASGVTTGSFYTTQATTKTVTATVSGADGGLITDNALVTVNAAAASQLVITTQPAGATSNVNFTTQPVVQLRDPFGNNVPQSAVAVLVTVFSGTGSLVGTTTVNTNASGQAVYATLQIEGLLTGYGNHQLRFTSGSLTAATSNIFNVLVSHAYNIQTGIYNVACSSCHVLSYANTVNQPSSCPSTPTLIVPNNTSASHLYRKVANSQLCGGVMPPSGANATYIDIIGRWINQGAPNN